MDTISPPELKQLLLGPGELALIDIREQGTFSDSHLLFAVCIPLSRMELLIADLVPRTDVPMVVVDDSGGDDARLAMARLTGFGYSNVVALEGGVAAWQAAGLEVFSGVNVPSKAFGEFVEHTCGTPRLAAAEIKALLDDGSNMVIVDSRPFEEYHRMNIPGAINMPGAELAFRIHDVAPDPETLVVVNCAGRTRSIIGAQSLVNAGIPNRVVALKDGTMGWHLAGFELQRGSTREAPAPGESGLAKALAARERVASRFGIRTVTPQTVEQWRNDAACTTYLLDVRSPAEYERGHLPGYRNAPGGQLVQATDEYVAVRNAKLVLADDVGVRATMTASWLVQMGWTDVYVLEGGVDGPSRNVGRLESGKRAPVLMGHPLEATIAADRVAESLENLMVIDLGPSTTYGQTHIPGASWCGRRRLADVLANVPSDARVVLTSPDGLLARFALGEARALTDASVEALQGGTNAWVAGGRAIETGLERAIGDTNDVWYKPYEHRGAQEQFMRDYLTWEVALVEQIERDGTTRFRTFQ